MGRYLLTSIKFIAYYFIQSVRVRTTVVAVQVLGLPREHTFHSELRKEFVF